MTLQKFLKSSGHAAQLLPLYLRREPTTDSVVRKYAPKAALRKFDVVAYKHPAATRAVATWRWDMSGKPRKDQKTVAFNCYRWAAHWLPDLVHCCPEFTGAGWTEGDQVICRACRQPMSAADQAKARDSVKMR